MVTDPQVSPDGGRVIYTRTYFDITTDTRMGDVWLAAANAPGLSDRRLLVAGAAKASEVRWSPDGRRIAYVAPVAGKPQLHVMTLEEGVGRPITSGKLAPSQIAWSPDGRTIAFVADVEAAPVAFKGMPARPEGATWAPPAKVISSFRYRGDAAGYRVPGVSHVFVVPADGGAVRQVTKGELDQAEGNLAWTPDGRAIVASASFRPDRDLRARDSDLYVIPLDGSKPRQLTSSDGDESQPSVSPDGKWVAFSGTPEVPTFYAQPHVWVVPLAGGAARDLTAKLDREVQAPRWQGSGAISFLYYDQGIARVGEVPAAGGDVRVLARQAGGTRLYLPSSGTSYSCNAGTCAYPTLLADRPAGLGVTVRGREASYDPNAAWRTGKLIGRMEAIKYKAPDGESIDGWVQFPPDFDPARKYPLALEIHGGPNADYGPDFSFTHQLYAAAGYVVLFTNPRGSIGYGERFANLIDKTYPGKDYDDLMAGVDAMLKRPYIDKRNTFIGGGSGGGVLTTWAIGKTDRFRAAVALRPVTDWTIQALTSDIQSLTTRYWMANALPWEAREAYWARSTLSLVGNVKTPTLLIDGEADYRTPIAQTEAYYQALKIRGIDTAMVRLPEAGHGMGRPSQWLTTIYAAIDWYDRYKVR